MAERSGPPEPHASFLRSAVARLREDPRVVGIGAGGSYLFLYGSPLLHVDLKFVSLPDVAKRVEDPAVL